MFMEPTKRIIDKIEYLDTRIIYLFYYTSKLGISIPVLIYPKKTKRHLIRWGKILIEIRITETHYDQHAYSRLILQDVDSILS
jgi:hypothetical protein